MPDEVLYNQSTQEPPACANTLFLEAQAGVYARAACLTAAFAIAAQYDGPQDCNDNHAPHIPLSQVAIYISNLLRLGMPEAHLVTIIACCCRMTRMPSLACAAAAAAALPKHGSGEQAPAGSAHAAENAGAATSVNLSSTFYMVNPSGDLPSTQASFQGWFQQQANWQVRQCRCL